MKLIYATYNQYCNSIDITIFDNMLLRIDCSKAEDGLKITPNSQCAFFKIFTKYKWDVRDVHGTIGSEI